VQTAFYKKRHQGCIAGRSQTGWRPPGDLHLPNTKPIWPTSCNFFRCPFTAAWGQRGTLPYTSSAALQWLRFSLIIILFSLGMLKTSDTEYLEEEKIQAGKETSVRLIVIISLLTASTFFGLVT